MPHEFEVRVLSSYLRVVRIPPRRPDADGVHQGALRPGTLRPGALLRSRLPTAVLPRARQRKRSRSRKRRVLLLVVQADGCRRAFCSRHASRMNECDACGRWARARVLRRMRRRRRPALGLPGAPSYVPEDAEVGGVRVVGRAFGGGGPRRRVQHVRLRTATMTIAALVR